MQPNHGPEFKRRLQLNWDEQQALITQLRDDPSLAGGRSAARFDFGQRDLPFTVVHPDGFVSSFLVYGRNISSEGMSVLHGGYVHPGTMCRVILPLVRGAGRVVEGNIRHCRLIRDACHEVGIKFGEPIEPREIVGVRIDDSDAGSSSPNRPVQLIGDILLNVPKGPMRQLIQHRLATHGLNIRLASTAIAVHEELKRVQCDLIVHGLSMLDESGVNVLRDIRQSGFAGPLLAMTADHRPVTTQAILDAGADDVLTQPFLADAMVAQIVSFLGPFEVPSSITSSSSDLADVRELLPAYLDFTQRAAERLEQMSTGANREALREVAFYLKATAIDFGFVHLAAAAFRLSRALNRPRSADDLSEAIEFLANSCRVCSPGERSRAA